jgi:magnesium-transporting ATPase (P-type)
MVTGDNLNTALSVARECGMIDGSRAIQVKAIEEENGDAKIGFHQVRKNKRL